ncbi:MAG: phage holin family protein [Actinomycetes bacterium]
MKVPTGSGILTLGAAVFGAGCALGAGYWIYAVQTKGSYWAAPGMTAVVVAGCGLIAMLVGLFVRDPLPPGQTINAGPQSHNVQAGRDINLGEHK